MKKYQELHATIQSLDGHEVRYFKLFAQRHVIGETNTYLKLFDAIRKQPESNDNDLRKIFKNEAFVKNLPSAKLYLLRLINKSLYHFHDKEDALSVILRHIKLAELFFSKGQYELAESNLKKAKKLSEKEEQFIFSLLVSELQIKLSIYSAQQHKVAGLIVSEMNYEKEIFTKYLNLREYQHAEAKFKTLEKTIFIPQTTSEKKQYDAILNQELFTHVSKAISDKAKNIFYELKNSYQDKLKDKLQKQDINNEILDFFIEHPKLFRKNAGAFIKATDEYLQDCLTNKNYVLFESGLQKFKALQAPSTVLEVQIISRAASLELKAVFQNDSLFEIKNIIHDSEKELKQFEPALNAPLLVQLYYEASSCFFLKNKFRDALKWNLKITPQLVKSAGKNELITLMSYIIHYRLKNDDYLLSKIASEKRKQRELKNKNSLEVALLDTLESRITSTNKSGLKQKELILQKEINKALNKKQFAPLFEDPLFNALFTGPNKFIFLDR